MGRRRKPRNRTRVFIVQDKSGSMSSRVGATISGFNEYVDALDSSAEGEVLISVIQFDTVVATKYLNKPLEDVEDFTAADFVPGGMTALRDGVGQAIKAAEASSGADDKILVVIMTDGGENSSREYSQDAILKLLEKKRGEGWEFVFLGAGEEAWSAGQSLGFVGANANKAIFYGNSAHTHQGTYTALAAATSNVTRGAGSDFDPAVKSALEQQ